MPKTHKAAFGAGCFWGVEEFFRTQPGVIKTTVGYMGGTTKNPTYKDVCDGNTNHAEVVLIEFNPNEISFERLVSTFFKIHDPTTLNRQGPDVGTQYRSAIFTYDDTQKEQAERIRQDFSGDFKNPIVTTIEPAPAFYEAEEYHQKYLLKRGMTSCHI